MFPRIKFIRVQTKRCLFRCRIIYQQRLRLILKISNCFVIRFTPVYLLHFQSIKFKIWIFMVIIFYIYRHSLWNFEKNLKRYNLEKGWTKDFERLHFVWTKKCQKLLPLVSPKLVTYYTSTCKGRMAIDLRKNKEALLQAYNEVVSDKNNVDWWAFTLSHVL